MTTNYQDELLTIAQVSEVLKVPKATIYGWRSRNYGPTAVKLGGHLRYREQDVLSWIDELADIDRGRFAR